MKPVSSLRPDDSAADNRPSVAHGDSIYYRHPETGAAHHGVVAAIGRDGVRVDADGGGEHCITWDGYLGHRKRVDRRLTIVDRGEDGTIMRDEAGKLVFVRGGLDDIEADEPIAKAVPVPDQNVELLAKARVIRELAAAGFEPMADHVRETFGDVFVYRQPAPEVGPGQDDVVAAIERMRSDAAAQAQGLAAAIGMLADRLIGLDSVHQALLAALERVAQPAPMSLTLPEGFGKADAPVLNLSPIIQMPEQPAPCVTFVAPEQPAPVVNVAPTQVDVHVPAGPAPVVNVGMPARKTITEIERNAAGDMVRAVQTEVEQR